MPQEALEWGFVFMVIVTLFLGVAIVFDTIRIVLEEMRDNNEVIPYGWRWNRERRNR